MLTHCELNNQVAVEDFHRMRKRAMWQQFWAWLTGKSAELLNYEQVAQRLRVVKVCKPQLREIPLNQIKGSVGRSNDFTADFLPKKDSDESRWAGVRTAVLNMTGFGPIDVYQIDDTYFVSDGNHRVSVSKQLGVPTISARVSKVITEKSLNDLNPTSQFKPNGWLQHLFKHHHDIPRAK